MFRESVYTAIQKLDNWIETHDWKAYDPFDGLSSKFTGAITFGNAYLRIALQQFNRRFPINMRSVLGIKPETSSKAMGFFAQGYLSLFSTYKIECYLTKVKYCLRWLQENNSRGYSGYSWGNHFDYQSRGGRIPKDVPTVVWTGLIGHSFLDAYDQTENEEYLEIAKSICTFILKDLPWIEWQDTVCLNYTPQHLESEDKTGNSIHNANMIGASILARVYSKTGKSELLDLARKSVKYTIDHQLENGAWFYGVGRKWEWVDSFHTGYVLESLWRYIIYSGDEKYKENLNRGYKYYIDTFFEDDGLPRYYNHKTRPIDIQCASQGIQTLVNLRSLDERSMTIANKVAHWTIEHMQDPEGYFYYRKYPLIINKTPTLHWGQATMLAALALLNKQINGRASDL